MTCKGILLQTSNGVKVFFDGSIFASQKQGGISRVAFELMKNLNQFKDIEKIFYRGLYVDNYPFQKKWFTKYYGLKKPDTLNHRAFNLLDTMGMEAVYRANAVADTIFHSLFYRVAKKPKGPVVVHAYDMTHELYGGGEKSIAFKKKALATADMIITISHSTKNDIVDLYPKISPDKISVVHLGVSEAFFLPSISRKVAHRPYILYVGPRGYAYKNFDLLLDVFIEKRYFEDFDLIVFGGENGVAPAHLTKINATGRADWFLHRLGSDADLVDLYAGATVFVYPSLYEGFGIPPLEAMAAGCPVIASNASSIPEVVGEAGILFNPEDKNDLAFSMEKIFNDKALAATLVAKGRACATQFSWQKMAAQVYECYRQLLAKRG